MNYLGDYPTGQTVYIYFNTYNAAGASVTMTGFAVADILVYKNGSTTQRSSTSGFTLLDTDGTDFDSITGVQGFSIDLSDNTDAGFFAAGNDYTVFVSTVTIDGQTVTAGPWRFSLQNRYMRGTDSAATASALTTAQADLDDIQNRLPAALVNGRMDASVGAMAANTMTAAAAAADLTTELQNGLATAASIAALNNLSAAQVNAEVDTAIADAALATAANLAIVAGYLDTEIPAILQDTGTDIPAQIAALNNLSAAQVNAEVDTALADYDGPTKAELDAGLAALNNISAADVWAHAARTLTANTNLNDPTAAQVAAAVLTTAMTESYNADGAAPTLAQAMFLALQMLTHMTIVGTTLTVYKLDGTTAAATFTLDSATAPTSITRAT